MKRYWCAAIIAALLPYLALPTLGMAQDVTLTSRDGALAIAGTLQGYDGEFFRIESAYGPLTIDATGVICDGPACPDLTAPKAVIRLVGEADAGRALLPPLIAAFAKSRGLLYAAPVTPDAAAILTDPATGKVLAEISFRALPPDQARAELKAGRAELMVASVVEPDLGSKAMALDALVPIVAPDNPLPGISTIDLAQVLAGEVKNWAEVGGPDMPLVLHGLAPDSDLQRALSARLGRDPAASVTHADLQILADAVAKDPWAIALTGRASVGVARALPLSDSCGFPLLPSGLAVKAGDYPLTLPVFLLTPRRRLPLMAREFLEFLTLPTAQAAIASGGYIDRSPESQPMTADGLRLINAIQGAGAETTLADLKRLVDLMDGTDRLSLTFRFQDGTSALDAASQDSLAELVQLIEAGVFREKAVILAGFSDGSGEAKANLELSRDRADGILAALKQAAAVPEAALPRVEAFGEALPMACDETAAGRRLNRRVEVWLKPSFAPSQP
ncbi:phosphate ABC transporter substrate-binding/OmpA family protein [Cypionkella sp.]|uniref:phosphate ABC transporter substrate-binding/OmpA family protein n=1 Tax=Cypionkella sp. TaxID=2811411 RepID=UPI002ABBF9DE|nr:phosphate ABC transporter substrate-binding/OmpA family protein [Cypionkella sp.]MDZ4391590.1 phosphate ABC transporter substrate-binding/OmpA family protein [Cypionkella sp.]